MGLASFNRARREAEKPTPPVVEEEKKDKPKDKKDK